MSKLDDIRTAWRSNADRAARNNAEDARARRIALSYEALLEAGDEDAANTVFDAPAPVLA